MKTAALIVAAGSSERFGGPVPKQFREVAGRPLLAWTIERFERAESIDDIVVVVAEEYMLHASQKVVDPFGFPKVSKIVPGGATRQQSVRLGLEALPISTGFVAIHDGARPLIMPDDIDAVVAAAHKERAALLAIPAADTLKRVEDRYVIATIDRTKLWRAQTPQVFQYDLIMEAHREYADEDGFTDDASLAEARGFKVRLVEPGGMNPKITTRRDMEMLTWLLKEAGDA